MTTIAGSNGKSAAGARPGLQASRDGALDLPRGTDFTDPHVFLSSRKDTVITYVSPSIKKVLGFTPDEIIGGSFTELLCAQCPLNEDDPECQRIELNHGQAIHALRSIWNRAGDRRILSVRSIGVARSPGETVLRRHHVMLDVTESVQEYVRVTARIQELSLAESRLSVQELHVAERILDGLMNRAIATELSISERTVDRRRATILKRLNVSTTSEMIARLVERRLLQSCLGSVYAAHWQRARNSHRIGETRGQRVGET